MKMRGRVGDCPVIGSGAFADDTLGASSTTGHGESILKVMLAARAVGAIPCPAAVSADAELGAEGSPAQRAAARALAYMRSRVDGFGGAIVVLPSGDVGAAHTTARMAWGYARGTFDGAGSPLLQTAAGVSLGPSVAGGPSWQW